VKVALVLAVAALAAASPIAAQPGAPPPLPVEDEQPTPAPAPSPAGAPTPVPSEAGAPIDDSAPTPAADSADEAAPPPATVTSVTPPAHWTEWTVRGRLIDDRATIEAVLETEMVTHRALTESAQADLAAACERYGYELVGFATEPLPGGGVRAVLHIEPIPIVRRVTVRIPTSLWPSKIPENFVAASMDEEIRRRMRLREGSALPWAEGARQAALDEEAQRISEYLRDEGFFDATVRLGVALDGGYGALLDLRVNLGTPYHLGRVRIENERDLAIDGATLRDLLRRRTLCEQVLRGWCFDAWRTRFTRSEHQAALQAITQLFRNRGYPAVKVTSNFDPATSFDRRRHAVDVTLTVDQRRYIDVVFEGNSKDSISDETLRKRLTFSEAASADEYEVQASAAAIQAYYQGRGNFDAIVTWSRESFRTFDRIIYRIDEGPRRRTSPPTFVVITQPGDGQALSDAQLADAIGAGKYQDSWFRSAVRPSSASLAEDSERLRRAFRERGFPDAQVDVRMAPSPAELDSSAAAGAMLAADRNRGALHIRYVIHQGERTVLDQVRVTFDGPHRQRCATILGQIGAAIGVDDLASRAIPSDPCTAAGVSVPVLNERLESAAVKLKDWYWGQGRPRAEIGLKVEPGPARPNLAVADFRVREQGEVRIGKVLVRGNFRTRSWVIENQLDFVEGQPLTRETYETGPRNLRTTGLFNSVNVDLVNFDDTSDGKVNVVVRVEERYTGKGWLQLEGGWSSDKDFFASAQGIFPNLCLAFWRSDGCGTGTRFTLGGTYGGELKSVEGTLRFPRWIPDRFIGVGFDTDLSGLYRIQDTERFGELTTIGASIAFSRTWQRLASEDHPARSISWTVLRYDYRRRNRDDDALRAAGPDLADSRVPVTTTTGSVGTELLIDQRTDRTGNLSPLAPEKGFQLQLGVSYADPNLVWGAGDATFVKAYGAGQLYWRLSDRVLLRLDGRYDQGFVIGDDELLPEVERFFAGGDTTVRGYEEDRLATEIIEAGVPPLGGASQLRVLPAGGNIRALTSIDAQIRLTTLPGTSLPLASGLFVDAGIVRNVWRPFDVDAIRPAVGVSLFRIVTPVGSFALDYAVPIFPQLGDDPLGRLHISVALRN
jgi:outer membrane protein insertion porin family